MQGFVEADFKICSSKKVYAQKTIFYYCVHLSIYMSLCLKQKKSVSLSYKKNVSLSYTKYILANHLLFVKRFC